jgi:protocatechuate 3,4-dioxygenase alpha subunit
LLLSVLMRGQLQRLVTRIYFPDEEEANAADPVLRSLAPDAARTLVAVAERADALRFDICLQGPHETAFFRV